MGYNHQRIITVYKNYGRKLIINMLYAIIKLNKDNVKQLKRWVYMINKRIFISYSHLNIDVVNKIYRDLKNMHIDITKDYRDLGYTKNIE